MLMYGGYHGFASCARVTSPSYISAISFRNNRNIVGSESTLSPRNKIRIKKGSRFDKDGSSTSQGSTSKGNLRRLLIEVEP